MGGLTLVFLGPFAPLGATGFFLLMAVVAVGFFFTLARAATAVGLGFLTTSDKALAEAKLATPNTIRERTRNEEIIFFIFFMSFFNERLIAFFYF